MKKITLITFIAVSLTTHAQTTLWGTVSSGAKFNGGGIFKTDGSGDQYTLAHSMFRFDGDYPLASLTEASNGKLYGMTSSCCVFDANGVLFEYDPSTNTYSKKVDFNLTIGAKPYGALIQASDGKLYGTASAGGKNGAGVLFQFDPVNASYYVKVDFEDSLKGNKPSCTLTQTADGKIYGVTNGGGLYGYGVLFQYDPSTNVFIKKYDFDGVNSGSSPQGKLVSAPDGNLYGLTTSGGNDNFGVLFQYNPSTSTFTKKIDFDDTHNGSTPFGEMTLAKDGYFYGLTSGGGANSYGVLFQYDYLQNKLVKKIDFDYPTSGSNPTGALLEATDGKLYGMAQFGGTSEAGTIFQYDPSSGNLTKQFDLTDSTGTHPHGNFIQASDGLLYAMTYDGGLNTTGVLFQFNINNQQFTKKFDFHFAANGSYPVAGLTELDNMLYGISKYGGTTDDGVIFQIDPLTNSHVKKAEFLASTTGNSPSAGLTAASDGKLYGMTAYGGANNMGVLYQFDPLTLQLSPKITFDGLNNGANPTGKLLHINGKLYGLTYWGGTKNNGVLFEYTISSSSMTKMLELDTVIHGSHPTGGLMKGADGKLYGIASEGGAYDWGTLFQFDPVNLTITKKIDFDSSQTGSTPQGTLVQTQDGKFYGLCLNGGKNNFGTLFQFDPSASSAVTKVDFDGIAKGNYPAGSMFLASNGYLYGFTNEGGTSNYGVFFQYDPINDVYTKKLDFNGINGKYPDNCTLIETGKPNGLNEATNSLKIMKSFPNPSSGLYTVVFNDDLENATFRLMSITGQTIWEKPNLSGIQFTFNLSAQASGIYFMEVSADGKQTRMKIIKE